MLRPCIDCGELTARYRCGVHGHSASVNTTRRKRAKRPYTSTEQQRRKATVDAHRALHGDWCPGWRRAPHDATDLTADHIQPVAAGGMENGPLAVLCRRCNGAKQGKSNVE